MIPVDSKVEAKRALDGHQADTRRSLRWRLKYKPVDTKVEPKRSLKWILKYKLSGYQSGA